MRLNQLLVPIGCLLAAGCGVDGRSGLFESQSQDLTTPLLLPAVPGNGLATKNVCLAQAANGNCTPGVTMDSIAHAVTALNATSATSTPLGTSYSWVQAGPVDYTDNSSGNNYQTRGVFGVNYNTSNLYPNGTAHLFPWSFAGYIAIPPSNTTSTKTFALGSDDGAFLAVSNGTQVFTCSAGIRSFAYGCTTGSPTLPAPPNLPVLQVSFPPNPAGALYPIELIYYDNGGVQGLELAWQDGAQTVAPTSTPLGFSLIPQASLYAPDIKAALWVDNTTSAAAPVAVGTKLQYTAAITNRGTVAASGLKFTVMVQNAQLTGLASSTAGCGAPVTSGGNTWMVCTGISLAAEATANVVFTATVAAGVADGTNIDVQGVVQGLATSSDFSGVVGDTSQIFVYTDDAAAVAPLSTQDTGNGPAALVGVGPGLSDDDPTRVTVAQPVPQPPAITAPTGSLTSATVQVISGTSGYAAGLTIRVAVTSAGVTQNCTAVVQLGGGWTCPALALDSGTWSAVATLVNPAGLTGTPSAPFTLTIAPPPAPLVTAPANNGGSTSSPTFVAGTSSSPPGTTIRATVLDSAAGTHVCATTVQADQSWVCSVALVSGGYSVTATALSITGTPGTASAKNVFVVNLGGYPAPTVGQTPPLSQNQQPALGGAASASTLGAGFKVLVYDGATLLCTISPAVSPWTCTPGSKLLDGTHLVTAVVEDAGGNPSPASNADVFVIDTTKPGKPTLVQFASPTNNAKPVFSGLGEPGASVVVKDSVGNLICSTTVQSNQSWSCAPASALVGSFVGVTAAQTDPAGNASLASDPIAFTIDTTPPAKPGIDVIPSQPLANNLPPLSGTGAEVGATLTVRDQTGRVICSFVVTVASWGCTPLVPLADGTSTLTATVVDKAGNATASDPITIAVDTVAPAAPTVVQTTSPTANLRPVFAGTAEPGAKVAVSEGATLLCSVIANAVTGAWSCPSTVDLTGGPQTHNVTAVARDGAGNASAASQVDSFVTDTRAPGAPGLDPVAGSSGAQPGYTSNPQPTFSGTGLTGDLVTVRGQPGGAVLCSALVSAAGTWACTTSAAAALSGSPATAYTVVADQTSPSGVTSASTGPRSFTVLTGATAKPAIDPLPASSPNATPTLSGSAGKGDQVVVRDESGRVICSAAADATTGRWTCAAAPLHEGQSTLTAVSTGRSGLVSPASDPAVTSVDTLAPLPPSLVQTPSPTSNTLPTFTGTAEPLSQVAIFADGGATPVASCNADASGFFSCTATTAITGAPATHTCRATATDAAGNASGTSNADTFVVDTSTPVAPVLNTQPPAPGGQPGTTGNTQPVFSGTGTAGDTVTVASTAPSAQTLCTALVRADGTWSCTSSVALTGRPATSYTLSATQASPAGVSSPVTGPQTLVVDTRVPQAPTLLGPTGPSKTATVALSGTGTPGTRVEVRDATGAVVCTVAVVPPSGNWTCSAGPLGDGTSQLTAVTVGAGGIASGASLPIAVTVDTIAPSAPHLAPTTSPGSETLPVFTGTAEPGAQVAIFDGAGTTPVATCTADLRGVFRCPATVALTGGPSTHDVHAVATDPAGNASAPSNTDTFVVDTRLPIAPTLSPLPLPAGGQPGFTPDPQPVFSGTGTAGDTVVVHSDQSGAAVLCTAVVHADNSWSCQSTVVLTGQPATTYGVTATETSPAGVTSGTSSTETVTVVTARPGTPTLVVPSSPSGTGTPALSGTGDVGTTVVVHDGTGATVCTATVQPDGTWSCTATRLPDGPGTLTATSVGPSGLTSPGTSPAPITVDTQAPAAPGLAQTPSPLGITHPTFSGTAEAGSSVTVREGGQVLCTAVADSSGAYHCTSTVVLGGAPQTHSVTATATDLAGNTSAPSGADVFVVDTTVPPAPGIDLAPAPPGGLPGTTTSANPVITGTGSPGATVIVTAGGTTLCTAQVLADGTWRCTSTTALPGQPPTATTLTATQTTPAGITGPAGTQTLTVDTTAPAAPTLDAPVTPGTDPRPTFTGAGQPGAAVSLVDAYGRLVCRATVGADGRWSCRPAQPMSDGDYLLQALQTSPGGNQSGKSDTQPLSLRTLLPPVLAQPASPTRSAQPLLTGTGTPGRTVVVYSGQTPLCSAVVAADGSWSCAPSTALPSGAYALSAVLIDGAGHSSTPTGVRALVIDHDAPDAPGLDVPATTEDTQPQLSGTAEPGSTVTVRDAAGTVVCTAVVTAAGTWSCTPTTPLPLGPTALTADATDAAGNVSARSAADTVVVIVHVVPPAQLVARGGCASGGVPAPALVLLALFWFARRRRALPSLARAQAVRAPQGRAFLIALPLLAAAVLPAGAARAQSSTDLELFHPASGGDGFVGVEGARPLTSGDGKLEVKLWGGTSIDPLVTHDTQGNRQVLVSNRLASWLGAQVHVWDNFSIAAQLPIVLAQSGNLGSLTPSAAGSLSLGAAVGDLRVTPRWALLRQVEVGLDLAMQLSVDLPTGKAGSLSGTGRLGGEGLLALGRRFYTPGAAFFELLGNGYVRLRPPAQILDVRIGNELGLRAALGYYPNLESKAIPQRFFLEAEGRSWMRGGFASGTAPAEWRVGGTWCFGKGIALDAAAGTALGSGVGSPKARFLLGFGYSPEACRPSDRDGDGIADRLDKCPDQPGLASNGGCPAPPDADGDGVPDSEDACPAIAGLKENRGCPANWDRDGDGVPDMVDRCPEVPGPASNQGCPLPPAAVSCVAPPPPEPKMADLPLPVDTAPPPLVVSIAAPLPDRDGDGVPDAEDNCPDQPGPKENQGCPKTVKQLVVIKGDKIDILDKVFFASAKAIIEKRSYGLLDQVASVLKSHPELRRIEVQGHTDNGGDAKKNEKLSQSRAEAVVVYLIRGGVGIARMSAKGYGASQAAVPNTTKANREKNRRVEFHVLEVQNKTVEVQVPAKS